MPSVETGAVDLPDDLLPAINHLRQAFDHWRKGSAAVTSNLCFTLLHGREIDYEQMQNIAQTRVLLQWVGSDAAARHHATTGLRIEPAIFKAFMNLHFESMSLKAHWVFKRLLKIGFAHERRLGLKAHEFATTNTHQMILASECYIAPWVRKACDGPESDAITWRAPGLILMKPSQKNEYVARDAWSRYDSAGSITCLGLFTNLYLSHLLASLKDYSGAAALDYAMVATAPDSLGSEGRPDAPLVTEMEKPAATHKPVKGKAKPNPNTLRIVSVIEAGLKELSYCKVLDSRMVKPPNSWKDWPGSYEKAWTFKDKTTRAVWQEKINEQRLKVFTRYCSPAKPAKGG